MFQLLELHHMFAPDVSFWPELTLRDNKWYNLVADAPAEETPSVLDLQIVVIQYKSSHAYMHVPVLSSS